MEAKDNELIKAFIKSAKESSLGTTFLAFLDVLAWVLIVLFAISPVYGALGSTFIFFRHLSRFIGFVKTRKLFSETTRRLIPIVISYFTIRNKEKGGVHFMKKLKKLGIAIWGNKFTELGIAVSAGAGYTAYILIPFAYINIIVAGIVFLASSYLIVSGKVGVESVQQITDRIAKVKLTKAELEKKKAKEKAVLEMAEKIRLEKEAKEKAKKDAQQKALLQEAEARLNAESVEVKADITTS